MSEGWKYSVILAPSAGGEWTGTFTARSGSKTTNGKVTAKPYLAEDDSMVWVGRWPEGNNDYAWLVDHIDIEGDDEDDA